MTTKSRLNNNGKVHFHKGRRHTGNTDSVGEIRKKAEESQLWIWNIQPGKLAEDSKSPGDENTPQDTALDIFYQKDGCN